MRVHASFTCVAAILAAVTSARAQSAAPGAGAPPQAPAPDASATAAAQTGPESRPLEVTVQGARPGTRGTTVEKLDRKTLDRLGVTSVAEAVERSPSVMAGYGGRGERIVTLRGFDQRQLLVTIDGVPVQVPYDGQLDLGKIPLGLIDHVTLIKGAGSLLYGPNGLGGAIAIATRRPGEGPMLTLATETAPFYAQRMSATSTFAQGPVSALAGVAFENARYAPMSADFTPTYNENGGQRDNSDRRNGTVAGKVRWEINDANELVASVWRFEGKFGVPPGVYDLTPRYWRWTDWYVNTYAFAHGYRKGKFTLDETLYYSTVGNTLDTYDNASYTTQRFATSTTSIYADKTAGGNARIAYSFACAEKRCVSARGWFGAKKDWHESQADTGAAWESADTTTLTGAGQLDGFVTRRVRWLAGTQVDGELPGRSSSGVKPDKALAVGPMGGLTFQPIDPLEITANAAQRSRFPTLRERFSAGSGNLEPNPGLKAERATNLSLDVGYRPVRQVRIDLGVFDSEVRNMVDKVHISSQLDQWRNVERARLYGVEAAVRMRPRAWLELWAGWASMRARRLDLDAPNDKLEYRPEHKGIAAFTLFPIPIVAVTLVSRFIGAQNFKNPESSAWGRLGAMELFDARVDVNVTPELRVWVRGTNLADANVQWHYSYPDPGRQIFAGASFTWAGPSEGPTQPGGPGGAGF